MDDLQAKNKKIYVLEKIQLSKLNEDYIICKQHQNKAITEIRRAKRSFERNLSLNIKGDPKSCYAYVRSQSKSKTNVGPLINTSSMQVEDDEEKSETLNDYFSSCSVYDIID